MDSPGRSGRYPKRPYWSALNTTNNSPETARKANYHLVESISRDPEKNTTAMFTRVAVGELDDVTSRTPTHCDVTAECFLFLVVTSLTVLMMVAAMTVLVLHFVSGGKVFSKNREDGKNSTFALRPHFNFKT